MRTLILRALIVIAAALLIHCTAKADIVKIKGRGEGIDEGTAINQAKINALSRYAASFDSAKFDNFKKIERKLVADIDEVILDYTLLNSQFDEKSKKASVVIEASINDSEINGEMQGTFNPAPNSSTITFVFVARELASKTSYVPKDTRVQETQSSTIVSEGKGVSENTAIAAQSFGGNTETKSENVVYKVNTVEAVDNAVNSVLTTARYETTEAGDAKIDVAAFERDFGSGNDISQKTRDAAVKACHENNIRFLAVAYMSVGQPGNDEATGLKAVYVTVMAKVSDLSSHLPRTVASITGIPYKGLGVDSQVATQNALNYAAEQSAKELVNQLRLKSVH